MPSIEGQFDVYCNTGCSIPVTFNSSDFVRPPEPYSTMLGGIAGGAEVVGKGTIEWHFQDDEGTERTIRTEAYYVPSLTVRLLSPQRYFYDVENAAYFERMISNSISAEQQLELTKFEDVSADVSTANNGCLLWMALAEVNILTSEATVKLLIIPLIIPIC